MKKVKATFSVHPESIQLDGSQDYIKREMAIRLAEMLIKEDLVEFSQEKESNPNLVIGSIIFTLTGLYMTNKQWGIIGNKLNELLLNERDEMNKTRIMEIGRMLSP